MCCFEQHLHWQRADVLLYSLGCCVNEISNPNWDAARRLIAQVLDDAGLSMNSLARTAGMRTSVISRFLAGRTAALDLDTTTKIYTALRPIMNHAHRRDFLKFTGLGAFFEIIGFDVLLDLEPLPGQPALGRQLLNLGSTLEAQGRWQEALPFFHRAEHLFGPASSQAAYAACQAAQMHLNLGAINQAIAELDRVWQTYGAVLDPETEAEYYRVRGWIAFYRGLFDEANRHFLRIVKIARDNGAHYLEDDIQHFLARTFYHMGQLTTADHHYQRSLMFTLRRGSDVNIAFEYFRQAQLRRREAQESRNRQKYHEAQQLLDMARMFFGHDLGKTHIVLEEARMSIDDECNDRLALLKAHEALEGWVQLNSAKGIANSLYVVAQSKVLRGEWAEALPPLVAAILVHPPQSDVVTVKLWDLLADVRRDLLRTEGYHKYSQIVDDLHERMATRQGYFHYLTYTVFENVEQVNHVFQHLR